MNTEKLNSPAEDADLDAFLARVVQGGAVRVTLACTRSHCSVHQRVADEEVEVTGLSEATVRRQITQAARRSRMCTDVIQEQDGGFDQPLGSRLFRIFANCTPLDAQGCGNLTMEVIELPVEALASSQ
jgi:hypothetical protein